MDHVKEIVLVRHGETIHNIAPRVGRFLKSPTLLGEEADSPDHRIALTPKGREQAKQVGPQLSKLAPFDAYFDSGYTRTVETLDLILEAFDERERDPRKRSSHLDLRERESGYTFNMSVTEVNTYFPWYQEYEATFGQFYATPPGGESIAHVCSRVHTYLSSIRRARAGQRLLIVTHGRVMLCFRYWLEKLAVEDVEGIIDREESIPNCGVLRYFYNEDTRRYDKIEPWDQR
jgi:broad specificity phosphatase PhoE